jgi:hypothetical protein
MDNVIFRNLERGLKIFPNRIGIGDSTIQWMLGITIDPDDKRPELIGPTIWLKSVS